MGLVEKRHLPLLRKEEIEAVQRWFKPDITVLEIGGGNGYQAKLIASWGCEVQSIDLPQARAGQQYHFPVQDYDGQHLPFSDESCDLVFSSNVLEHVEQLELLLAEIRRVLRPGGMSLHILPSPFWRMWTSLAHYLAIIRYLTGGGSLSAQQSDSFSVQQTVRSCGLGGMIRRALLAGPHGVYPSAFSELYYFSSFRWKGLFRKSGFQIIQTTVNGLFYTGYGLIPSLSMRTRRRLAHVLGSACNIFLLKKPSS